MCACGCYGCVCDIWKGTGSIPHSQNTNDVGWGSISATTASSKNNVA